MEKELQDNQKLLAEFMGAVFNEKNIAIKYPEKIPAWAKKVFDFDSISVGGYLYAESFDWQIPVWAKLCRLGDIINQKEYADYWFAVRHDNPRAGFDIIVNIIKRIKQ